MSLYVALMWSAYKFFNKIHLRAFIEYLKKVIKSDENKNVQSVNYYE